MMSWQTRLVSLLAGGVLITIFHFAFYDPLHKSPSLLRPALLIYCSAFLFLAVNFLTFAVNVFKSLASIRGSKDEQHIQEVMEPAFQGRITDIQLLRWTDIPFFVTLGTLIAAIFILVFS
jgi:hypothetical protein